jgi:hypothetical protein
MLFKKINKTLQNTLAMMRLNTNLWFIWDNIEVFTNMQIKTIMANCVICKIDVPLDRINIAAAAPRQLCPITAIVEEPIKFCSKFSNVFL